MVEDHSKESKETFKIYSFHGNLYQALVISYDHSMCDIRLRFKLDPNIALRRGDSQSLSDVALWALKRLFGESHVPT